MSQNYFVCPRCNYIHDVDPRPDLAMASNEMRCAAHGPFDPRCEKCPHCLQAASLKRLEASAPLSPAAQEKNDEVSAMSEVLRTSQPSRRMSEDVKGLVLSPAPAPLKELIEDLDCGSLAEREYLDAETCRRIAQMLSKMLARSPQPPTSKLERQLEIVQRSYDALELCPDHRDKRNGRCIVCVAEERTRREVKLGSPHPPVCTCRHDSGMSTDCAVHYPNLAPTRSPETP